MKKIIEIDLDGNGSRFYEIEGLVESELNNILSFFRNCIAFDITFKDGYHAAIEEYCRNFFNDCVEIEIKFFD